MRTLYTLVSLLLLAEVSFAQWQKREVKYVEHQLFEKFYPTAVNFSDSSNGYVVGNNGVLKYSKGKWSPILQNLIYLNAVFTVNPRNTFITGYNGLLLKYDGDLFKTFNTGITTALHGIYMIDSTLGWAVGEKGTILKIAGDTTFRYPIFPNVDLSGVFFDSPSHGWAIGQFGPDVDSVYRGFLYEFRNDQWLMHSSVDDKLNAITGTPSGTVYVAGNTNLYRFNTQLNSLEQILPEKLEFPLLSLSMPSDTFGICVGANRNYLVFKNKKWSRLKSEYSDIFGVKCLDDTTIWAISQQPLPVFDQLHTNNPYTILKYEGNNWVAHSLDYLDVKSVHPFDYAITNVAGLGRKHVRINGSPINLPDATDWPDSIPLLQQLYFTDDVKIFSEDVAWGNSHIFLNYIHHDTLSFVLTNDVSVLGTYFLAQKMHMFDDTSAYFIGYRTDTSVLLPFIGYFKNRDLVKKYEFSTTLLPNGIHFANRKDGWIVGDLGLIARYKFDIDEWERYSSPTKEPLYAVFTVDSENAWCAGAKGTLLKYDGIKWTNMNINTSKNLHALYFTDKDHGWAAGQDGVIFKYINGVWTKDTSITKNNLASIYMVDPNYGWIGGDFGTLLQYSNPDSTISGRTSGPGISSSVSPNPANSNTTIKFDLKKSGTTLINIYDKNGRKTGSYSLGSLEPGAYYYKISVLNLLSGIYIYHIISSSGETGNGRFVKP
ncbi:MAG TPA: T9SS type A sorting domain-containing protein [Agriterribacter sp.]|nr:T9SS type A sorting domain-containing protein [Agriterribacter sp.]